MMVTIFLSVLLDGMSAQWVHNKIKKYQNVEKKQLEE